DISADAVDNAIATIGGSLERLIKKGQLTAAQKAACLDRIRGSTDYAALARVDLVIEAATENEALMLKFIDKVDEFVCPDALIGSFTSSL
ncbi:3-hydroxybutyryl-CoA dehydrogenase, partial [Aromatoleum toluclasticum]|uniref:3-hydroxyacyl-CoA dehydrogenase NAD-binding domain-containing protein n=1 Tax=Aromatoleum toluclasticum TaxID=92003 RepID=UPI001D197ECD